MFTSEIGDTTILHGMIAVTLYVRTADVSSGTLFVGDAMYGRAHPGLHSRLGKQPLTDHHARPFLFFSFFFPSPRPGAFSLHQGAVSKLATGVDLGPMGKAPNKGMCGLSARYFDASFAFVSAHFTSDSKGRNRLAKRNKDAYTVLKELALVGDAGFDVQNMHHHGEPMEGGAANKALALVVYSLWRCGPSHSDPRKNNDNTCIHRLSHHHGRPQLPRGGRTR